MKTRLRNIVLALLGLLLLAGIIAILQVWPVICPQREFSHQVTLKRIEVYSDQPLDSTMLSCLDEVLTNLHAIPLDDGKTHFRLFLCHAPQRYANFAEQVGKSAHSQGFHVQPLGHTFVNIPLIDSFRRKHQGQYRYSLLEGNIAHIITHEFTHQLIAGHVGYWQARNTEDWKLEGYCEYAASKYRREHDSTFHWTQTLGQYQTGGYGGISPGRQFYVRSFLQVAFLLDEQGYDFATLMAQPMEAKSVFEPRQQSNHPR